MAINPTITTLGELYHQEEDHDDDGILERLKQLAVDNLPEGWMDWQVRLSSIEDLVDPDDLGEVRFALPTVGIAKAFNPNASDLMEKPYRNMKMKMLNWEFCRGLLYSPSRLCIRIRRTYKEQLRVLQAIHGMQPLLLTRSEASKQLSESKSQNSTSSGHLAISTRMDSLENKLDRTLEVLGSILKNMSIKEEQYEDDGYSSRSGKETEDEVENQSRYSTKEQKPSPDLLQQKLSSRDWDKIGYSEDQNFNLHNELLDKTSYDILCHILSKQKQYFQNNIMELSYKYATEAKHFISMIEGEQFKDQSISGDVQLFIAGQRAEMMDLCGRYHQMSMALLQKIIQSPETEEEEKFGTLRKE